MTAATPTTVGQARDALLALNSREALALVDDLNQAVHQLALAGLRQRYPNDSEAQRGRLAVVWVA